MSQSTEDNTYIDLPDKIKWFLAGFLSAVLVVSIFVFVISMRQPTSELVVCNTNEEKFFIGNRVINDNFIAKVMEQVKREQKRKDIILVNKDNGLPYNYQVSLTMLDTGIEVATVMYEDLCKMLSDGEKQEKGTSFLVASGHRTREKQAKLLEEEIRKNKWMGMNYYEAREDALLTVAPAGFSEHETGLAVDIVAATNQMLDETQELTRENKWLREHCHKYGFILRYPRGERTVTGFSYESWHFRYVGKEAAKEITEQGITLEEYLE